MYLRSGYNLFTYTTYHTLVVILNDMQDIPGPVPKIKVERELRSAKHGTHLSCANVLIIIHYILVQLKVGSRVYMYAIHTRIYILQLL